MKIKEIGGEFSLIERLAGIVPLNGADVIQGIGDDAAVLKTAPEPAPYLLVTTDMLVEDQHFKTAWSSPEQVGFKAAESNVSDIAAMGGTPTWMFVSLALTQEVEVAWVEGLYRGLAQSCSRHGIVVAGGDTTHGATTIISITLLGSVLPHQLCLRSHAQPGDLLMLTGSLGASAAALALLNHGRHPTDYLLGKYHQPTSRRDVCDRIAPLAHAMIDISDGLASEVRHICTQSQVGAEILAAHIPLHLDVIEAAATLGMDPLHWALNGGEDYELLFSIEEKNVAQLQASGVACHQVGRITAPPSNAVLIHADGARLPLTGGYNHFGSS